MKTIFSLKKVLLGLGCVVTLKVFAFAPLAPSPTALGHLPLYFEAVPEAASSPTQFITRGADYRFLLSPAEVRITLAKAGVEPAGVRMKFAGADSGAQMSGDNELPGKISYLIGSDSSRWHTGLATFARVRIGQLYPGIDLVYYGDQRQLEYDFTAAPGIDPGVIKIHFDGVDKITIGDRGELLLAVPGGEIRQPAPVIYQMMDGRRQAINGGYKILNPHTVAFTVGLYNHNLPLVIDPVLYFSTYFGGNSTDLAWATAVDTNGFIYVAGQTLSIQTSATNLAPFSSTNAFQRNFAGGGTTGDAFIAKFDNQGSNLVYLTYLGGTVDDVALCMAVDNAGDALVGGYTDSPNFPVTPGAFRTNINGVPDPFVHLYPTDGFVAKLGPSGSNLVYSTYIGGVQADGVYGIAVDAADNAYVTGFTSSTNFPTTNALPFRLTGSTNSFLNYLACPNSFYFNNNAFVAEIASNGTSLLFSTYLGGTNYDWGRGIAVDASNYIYVTGYTSSTNFPTTNAVQQQFVSIITTTNAAPTNVILVTNFFNGYLLNGSSNSTTTFDAFVTKLAPGGTGWVYSTFLGGTNSDLATGIAADGAGNAYVTGGTVSTNFPNTVTNVAGLYNGLTNNVSLGAPLITNAFLTQIMWSGTNAAIGWSTVFGGTNFGIDVGFGVAVDPSGNVFVVGASSTTNFPAVNTPGLLQTTNSGGSDAFVMAFNANGSNILYSGYLGGNGNDYGYGIAVDSQTNLYLAGQTFSTNFPTFFPSQSSLNGTSDAFLAKIGWVAVPPGIASQPTNQVVPAGSVNFFQVVSSSSLVVGATGTPPLSYQWQAQGTNLVWTNLVNGGTNLLGTGAHIAGATTAILTINCPETNDSGNYQVIVTNYGGSVTSDVALLTVTNIPTVFSQQPMSQTVGVGSTVQFSINATFQQPAFDGWLKDGTNLINGGRISGATNSLTLNISNAQTNDDGTYWVYFTSPWGATTSSNAVLTVVSFPTIVAPPTNQTVGLGSTVAFVVNAVGQSTLRYHWQINGTGLSNGGRISGVTNSALIISNAQTSDDAGYSVIVTNTLGSVTSSPPAVLTVLTAPSFEGITAENGTNGVFILSGVGGTNNGPYVVLTSTNLSTPLGLWTPVGSNNFNSLGQFVFTNIAPTDAAQLFYILQTQ